MPARVGQWREVPSPKSQEILKQMKKYCVTSVQEDLVVGTRRFDSVFVYDADGHEYLDFFAGAGVSNLGHNPWHVREAIYEQLVSGAWQFDASVFPNQLQVDLCKRLAELSPGTKPRKVFLSNSGTEANEAALKIVFNHRPARKRIIAFEGAFHGRTGFTLPLLASKPVQVRHFPLAYTVHHFPFPKRPSALEELHRTIGRSIPAEEVNAVILELVQGEGGINIASKGAIAELVRFCKKYQIYLIVDEVQTGMGRTGTLFASEQYGLDPDIITLAKALTNGAVPCGATIIHDVLDFQEKGRHATTNGGNMLACAAAHAVLDMFERRPTLLEHVTENGTYLDEGLSRLTKPTGGFIPHNVLNIINPRGLGLMRAIDVEAWGNGTNYKENLQLAARARSAILQECFHRGLIVETTGIYGIRFTPPLIVTQEHIDIAIDIFTSAVHGVRQRLQQNQL